MHSIIKLGEENQPSPYPTSPVTSTILKKNHEEKKKSRYQKRCKINLKETIKKKHESQIGNT